MKSIKVYKVVDKTGYLFYIYQYRRNGLGELLLYWGSAVSVGDHRFYFSDAGFSNTPDVQEKMVNVRPLTPGEIYDLEGTWPKGSREHLFNFLGSIEEG